MELTQISDNYFMFSAKAPADLSVFNQTDDTANKIVRYGKDNNFPQELIKAVQSSPIANACVETHAKFLYGDGLYFETPTGEETDFSKKLKAIFNESVYQRICYDMAYFESLGLIMKWDLNGYLKSVKSQDFSTIRLGIPNKDFEITFAKLSSNWQQETKDRRYKAVPIDLYNDIETKAKISNFSEQSLYEDFSKWNGTLKYIRRYKPGQVYYSQPKYASALKWIYADGQIQNFHANNVDNSFAPAFIVYVPYKLTGEDENGKDMKESLREYIADRLTGADNGGKFAILDGSSKEGSIQIIPFSQSTSHEMYITLSNLIRDHIATAFQVPSILAGIQVSGKLGTAKEIADSSIYYQNAVIKHDQNLLMYEMNSLAKLMDGYDNINALSPLVANKVLESMSEAEIRSLAGLIGAKPTSAPVVTPINPVK